MEPPPGLLCPPDSLLPPWGSVSHRPCCVPASQQVRTIPHSRPDLQRIGSCHQDQQKWTQCECSTPLQAVGQAKDKMSLRLHCKFDHISCFTYSHNSVQSCIFPCSQHHIHAMFEYLRLIRNFIEYKNCFNLDFAIHSHHIALYLFLPLR